MRDTEKHSKDDVTPDKLELGRNNMCLLSICGKIGDEKESGNVNLPVLLSGQVAKEGDTKAFPKSSATAKAYEQASKATVLLVSDGPNFMYVIDGKVSELTKLGVKDIAPSASGVLLDAGGLVVTNYHLSRSGAKITARLADGTCHAAERVLDVPEADLAFFEIKADRKTPHVDLGSSKNLDIGEYVIATGHPRGWPAIYCSPGTVHEKFSIARLRTQLSKNNFEEKMRLKRVLGIDSHTEPGSSGSPVLGRDGKLVGLIFAVKYACDEDAKSEKAPVESLVVPVEEIKKALRRLPKLRKTPIESGH